VLPDDVTVLGTRTVLFVGVVVHHPPRDPDHRPVFRDELGFLQLPEQGNTDLLTAYLQRVDRHRGSRNRPIVDGGRARHGSNVALIPRASKIIGRGLKGDR
jgi:hypothetical protein